jgi:hypothetical protein
MTEEHEADSRVSQICESANSRLLYIIANVRTAISLESPGAIPDMSGSTALSLFLIHNFQLLQFARTCI